MSKAKFASAQEERETRIKFWEAAKTQFPDVRHPDVCWVLSEVLGWDWDKLKTIPEEGFDRKGYRIFLYEEDGSKAYNPQSGKVRSVYRNWTAAEKAQLKDWWWLLGL